MTAPDIFLSYNRSATFAGSGELVAHAVLEFAF